MLQMPAFQSSAMPGTSAAAASNIKGPCGVGGASSKETPAGPAKAGLQRGESGQRWYTLVDPNQHGPSSDQMKAREKVMSSLQHFLRKGFPDVSLKMYGSSCNGFGLCGSDVDMCFTLGRDRGKENPDPARILRKVVRRLEWHRGVTDIRSNPWARVKLISFTHRPSGFECDLSFGNTLAYHNTRLLKAYSLIDPRVRVLGLTMKHLMKNVYHEKCLADASKGGLSSYCFILLIIYYLQQCQPPVLPVLQELYRKKEEIPRQEVEGWNIWFFDRLDDLPATWTQYGQNQQSAEELWLDMLDFYVNTFDYEANVVSIRQRKPLTKFDKCWHSGWLAVEDPFMLSRDLGIGLTEKKWNGILKIFHRAQKKFQRSVPAQLLQQAADLSLPGEQSSGQQPLSGSPPRDQVLRLSCKNSDKHNQEQVPCTGDEKNFQQPVRSGRGRATRRHDVASNTIDECRRPGIECESSGRCHSNGHIWGFQQPHTQSSVLFPVVSAAPQTGKDLSIGAPQPLYGTATLGALLAHSLTPLQPHRGRGRARGRPQGQH